MFINGSSQRCMDLNSSWRITPSFFVPDRKYLSSGQEMFSREQEIVYQLPVRWPTHSAHCDHGPPHGVGDGDEVVAGVVLQHPQQTHHRHATLRLSPLCVIDDSPEDDDEHGKAVTPDVEFPGRGTDSLKLTDYIAWDTNTSWKMLTRSWNSERCRISFEICRTLNVRMRSTNIMTFSSFTFSLL